MTVRIDGLQEANQQLEQAIEKIRRPMTERFITEVLIVVAGYAAQKTPIATGTLINSQYRRVTATPTGYAGEVGYGAEYAVFVHDAPGTSRGEPRHPERLGTTWAPSGEPGFLAKGVEEMIRNDLDGIIRRNFDI